jgi:hypothetical protein
MSSVPEELLTRIKQVVPEAIDIISMDWAYDDEDYNVHVFVPDDVDVRPVKDRLLDAIMDYDQAHDTYTIGMVWHQRDKAVAGVR